MNAFILAAGLGTRLKPLTDSMPKALVPVKGKPLISHVIDMLIQTGFDNLVVNVHHFSQQIIDYLGRHEYKDIRIQISDESDKLLDTGGAIKKALPLFTDEKPLLIHNVDIFHNIDLGAFYREYSGVADAVLIVSQRVTSRYLLFDQDHFLVGWTNLATGEVKSPYPEVMKNPAGYDRYAFSGMHIFSPSLRMLMEQWGDRFSIIDFYLNACAKKKIIGVNIPNLQLLDVGKLKSLDEAEKFIHENGICN